MATRTAQLSDDARLAVITARTILLHEGYDYDYGKTAMTFGANAFEARFIELACYWSNDLMDLCLAEFGIEVPEHLQGSLLAFLKPRHEWLKKELEKLPHYGEGDIRG